jgi:hypothetical protein
MNTALKVIYGILGLALIYSAVLIDLHLKGWTAGVDNIQNRAQYVTGNAQDASENIDGVTVLVRQKASQIDVQPVNAALRNVQAITGNLKLASGHIATVAGQIEDREPYVEGGAVMLWQHLDNTIAHLDTATLKEQQQQTDIAEATVQGMKDLSALMTNPDIKMAISHVNGTAANLESTTGHVDHVAAHYDHELTAPKRWYQKLRDTLTAAGNFALRHL